MQTLCEQGLGVKAIISGYLALTEKSAKFT